MLATGSAITHATFVAQNSAVELEEGKAEDYALVFIAPMDTPGKKLISRNSYESAARSAWDNPLSGRFDENDAVVIFDDAFIPWENVLVYRDVKKATGFYAQSGFMPRYTLQSGTRRAVKPDFLCGRRAARDALERARPPERGATAADRPLLSRLDGRRPRPREAVQADLGRDGQRVRLAARVVRDQLQRQPGADAPGLLCFSGGRGILDDADKLVEQSLSEYDLDGFAGDTWLDPENRR